MRNIRIVSINDLNITRIYKVYISTINIVQNLFLILTSAEQTVFKNVLEKKYFRIFYNPSQPMGTLANKEGKRKQ